MKYRLLGSTGLYVSELCLGAMTFGGKEFWAVIGTQGQAEVNDMVSASIDAGINFIDTADVYSFGESETLLGKALAGRRDKVVLATKVRGRIGEGPNDVGLSRGHIMAGVEASLKRLGTDYIDLYQIHGFDPLTPFEETLSALDNLVQRGMVRYIGCSNLAAWQLMKALGISERNHLARFQSLQAYYTIAGRDLEREVIPLLKDQRLGLMVWSPLAGGLLSGKYGPNATDEAGRRAKFDFPPVDKDRAWRVVDAMRPIAAAHDASVAAIALAWLLHQDAVTTVIIGAKRRDQLTDNLRAPDIKLTADELKKLDEVSALPPEYPGWMIGFQGTDRMPGAISRAAAAAQQQKK
ncbi:MAG TPA: aldo/keto reductase [Kofleriaceae bacterium]|jgi:aryl-alcohol dehydrogenase-like predicted oxidoreductase|nr:aldo/keto reductase [Kofleriaceae bacterium]